MGVFTGKCSENSKNPSSRRLAIATLSHQGARKSFRNACPVPMTSHTPSSNAPVTSSRKTPAATDRQSHGVTQNQLDSLAEIMRQAVQQEQIAGGSFLVAHKGEIVFREAFGHADLESKRPFTTDELLPIASVSKPLMASVIMALVDQGKLNLDDPSEKYLPAFGQMHLNDGVYNGKRILSEVSVTECGDYSHLTNLREPTDWDGSEITFRSPVWPISFFTAARWGRVYGSTGAGRWSASFSFTSLQIKPWTSQTSFLNKWTRCFRRRIVVDRLKVHQV